MIPKRYFFQTSSTSMTVLIEEKWRFSSGHRFSDLPSTSFWLPNLSTFLFPLSTLHFRLALDRVHESPLDVVEKNNANKQHRESEAGAVAEIDPVERSAAEKGVAEGLDDRRHWICQDEPAETAAANH